LDGGSAHRKAAICTQNNTNTESTHKGIHASNGIRTHDFNVQAGEDSSCIRPRVHSDRHSGGTAPSFLVSELNRGEWSVSGPCHFTPGIRIPSTHWIGSYHRHQSRSGPCGGQKNLLPGCPSRNPSLYRLSYPDSSV
jgi:hypothetical protein